MSRWYRLWRYQLQPKVRAESGCYRVSLASRLQADPEVPAMPKAPMKLNNRSMYVQRVSDGSHGALRPRF